MSKSSAKTSAANARRNRTTSDASSAGVNPNEEEEEAAPPPPSDQSPARNSALILRNTSGSCTAPLPTMIPAHPVSNSSARARSGDVTSPFPITGTSSVSTAIAMSFQLARPEYPCRRVRGCSVTNAAPPSCAARRFSRSRLSSSYPLRSLSVGTHPVPSQPRRIAEGHSIQKKFTGQLKGDAIKC
eukprot:31295-Pelagococcus_subviridis.AAC.6